MKISDAKSSPDRCLVSRDTVKKPTVPRPFAVSLEAAVASMMNSRTTTSHEHKGGLLLTEYTYPAELKTMLRSLFSSGKSYDFQLHFSQTGQTSGAGALTNFLAWSPGVTSFLEWSALQSLFDEVKIVATKVIWTSAFAPVAITAGIPTQFALAPDNVTNGSAPAGYNAIQRLAESKVFSSHIPGASGSATMTKKHRPTPRPFASTTTPAVASPPSGCTGQWSYAMNIAGTVSINYMFMTMTNVYRFRSRA
jgi:surface antigen